MCIASLEEYVGIGTAEGTVRIYDSTETEIKVLQDRSVKGNPVTCLDIQRVDQN